MVGAALKTYWGACVVSACLVLLSPVGLFVILLSGDSCCGEDTTATMAGVTLVIVLLICVLGLGFARVLRHPVKRPTYRVVVGWAIIAGPVVLVHLGFVVLVSVTAF